MRRGRSSGMSADAPIVKNVSPPGGRDASPAVWPSGGTGLGSSVVSADGGYVKASVTRSRMSARDSGGSVVPWLHAIWTNRLPMRMSGRDFVSESVTTTSGEDHVVPSNREKHSELTP